MELDLAVSPEVIALTALLKGQMIDEDHTVGKLHRFWSWCNRHSADGRVASVTESWIDRYVSVTGWADAMVKVGWLEILPDGIRIPDWDRWNGRSAKKRILDARRAASVRSCRVASVTNVTQPTRQVRDLQQRTEQQSTEDKNKAAAADLTDAYAAPPTPAVAPAAAGRCADGPAALPAPSPVEGPALNKPGSLPSPEAIKRIADLLVGFGLAMNDRTMTLAAGWAGVPNAEQKLKAAREAINGRHGPGLIVVKLEKALDEEIAAETRRRSEAYSRETAWLKSLERARPDILQEAILKALDRVPKVNRPRAEKLGIESMELRASLRLVLAGEYRLKAGQPTGPAQQEYWLSQLRTSAFPAGAKTGAIA